MFSLVVRLYCCDKNDMICVRLLRLETTVQMCRILLFDYKSMTNVGFVVANIVNLSYIYFELQIRRIWLLKCVELSMRIKWLLKKTDQKNIEFNRMHGSVRGK